jgi:uncharacterized protein (DUF934 family)
MPKLIKQGRIIDDGWQAANPEASAIGERQILTLEQWLQLADKAGRAVMLEPGQAPSPLFDHLAEIPLVVVYFPVFTDGRGFSYGRELRERGYRGELRASGHFLREQLTYLHRCGFDAFQMDDEPSLEEALKRFADFSEAYQASIDQPLPLFRRRG